MQCSGLLLECCFLRVLRYNINPSDVGRLEVGTETIVDKSKSTKTVLMDLFPGNTDIEGATVINACYGGTAALLNAFLWVESSGWDGRYAIVVAADIATYARGPARPTCGCGAVAVLIGRDAPLVFDPAHRATHAANTWDFFKPDHTVEYPVVDGALSQMCYYRALEDCYERFCRKMNDPTFTAESPDYFVFHAPYNKLVQKSYARLFLCDARRRHAKAAEKEAEEKKQDYVSTLDGESNTEASLGLKEEWLTMPMEETYENRELEGALKKLSSRSFAQRLSDANTASKLVGNTYTASVFLGLASLLDRAADHMTAGKSIVVFSYGSGALATMYRLVV
jgi:hydroxymethylglutaryl-CoA synthase